MQISTIDTIESIQSLRKTSVYLYGAGVRGKQLFDIFTNRNVNICGYIVSSPKNNPSFLNGLPVISADNFDDSMASIVFAIDAKDPRKIVRPTIRNIYVLSDELYEKELTGIFVEKITPFLKRNGAVLANGNIERAHLRATYGDLIFRIPPSVVEEDHLDILEEKLSMNTIESLFDQCFGRFNFVKSHSPVDRKSGKEYAVYMVCSGKDKISVTSDLPKWLIPIQAGAALTDNRICDLTDSTGDNISSRNRDYSECTAIYWMWKNAPKTDYIGLCHYRRHFDLDEEEIDILGQNDYDLVTTIPMITWDNQDFFSWFTNRDDVDLLIKAINSLFPDYMSSANNYFQNIFTPPCNMFIMKYPVFQEYGEFVFGVSEYVYDYYRHKGITRNDRYMGYLIESLTGIFISSHCHELKIGYTDMKFLR